jgi:predicted dehydrogenase
MGRRHLAALLAGRATWNLDILQTCDVCSRQARQAAGDAGPPTQPTQHYEKVLDNKNIDAVFIASPDHWHARMAIDAIEAGKHVYLETPAAHTVEQAQELERIERANRHKVRVQVSVPSAGCELLEMTRTFLRTGGIGKLLAVHTRLDPARLTKEIAISRGLGMPNAADRGSLDWAKWLGHAYRCAGQPLAEACSWNPCRYSQFRNYWAYSAGWASEHFFHRLTCILKLTDLDYPDTVLAGGGRWLEEACRTHSTRARAEVPTLYNLLVEYPAGLTVRLIGSPLNDVLVRDVLVGEVGTITFNDLDCPTRAEIAVGAGRRRPGQRRLFTGAPGSYAKLQENFFHACRDSGVELICPLPVAVRSSIAISLGAKAFREMKGARFPAA